MKEQETCAPRTWSPALLDAFAGELAEKHQVGDAITPDFEQETGVRYHATNPPGWSGNLYRYSFSIHEMERTQQSQGSWLEQSPQ